MTVLAANSEDPREEARGGIYGAPVIGRPLSKARDLADSFEPDPDDSRGVRAGKHLVRGSAVAGATGIAMMTFL